MTIKIPVWAKGITDEGVVTFVAFAMRMCELHGYDNSYFMHKDDACRIINKRAEGLEPWLRKFACIEANMNIGTVLDHVMLFSIPQPELLNPVGGKIRGLRVDYELTDPRQKMVWMYLLGCLNINLIAPDDYVHTNDAKKYVHKNSYNVKEFNITREAAGYIKKQDRECEEEN